MSTWIQCGSVWDALHLVSLPNRMGCETISNIALSSLYCIVLAMCCYIHLAQQSFLNQFQIIWKTPWLDWMYLFWIMHQHKVIDVSTGWLLSCISWAHNNIDKWTKSWLLTTRKSDSSPLIPHANCLCATSPKPSAVTKTLLYRTLFVLSYNLVTFWIARKHSCLASTLQSWYLKLNFKID